MKFIEYTTTNKKEHLVLRVNAINVDKINSVEIVQYDRDNGSWALKINLEGRDVEYVHFDDKDAAFREYKKIFEVIGCDPIVMADIDQEVD